MNNKRYITKEEIDKICELNNSVRGTTEYTKYHMYCETKRFENGKWTGYGSGRWASIIYKNKLIVKKVKDKIYLISDAYTLFGNTAIDRYEVTDTIKEVLGL
jgi:hypothetical protein